MTHYLDRLNLRPNERRLVVFVAVVVFAVLNLWLVWPHFGDWRRTQNRLNKAQRTLETYQKVVKQLPEYEGRVRSFEKDNPVAAKDDQSIELIRVIQSKAGQSSVNIISTSRATTKTNDFFVEQMQVISVLAREEQLVNFLFNLGMGESMIRVRELSLRPDASRQQLSSNVKLVASYQRKPMTPAKPVPAVPVASARSARPAQPAAVAPASPAKPTVPIAKKP